MACHLKSGGGLYSRLRIGAVLLAAGEGLLTNEIDSWMTGVNRNVEGRQTPRIMRYSGGHPAYREHCDAVAAAGYRQLALD